MIASLHILLACSPPNTETYVLFDMKMVSIQGKDFFMGGAPPIAQPLNRISWNHSYWISDIEVTQQTYEYVTNTNPSEKYNPKRPVANILWTEALEFCNLLSELEKKRTAY